MVPLPQRIMDGFEVFFQHASAFAAAIMIKTSGLPAMQDGLFFFLPGLAIEVAQECSGIRSTLVLLITSLIAGYLLLRRPRDRAILAVAIIPLAILRNGFRIFSLAWLSVEVNPNVIDSALHHRGGPIFFALSLIPLFLLLLLLRKLERKRAYAS
jgi:exosortase